jgi:mono/diheme cytochrome c family protein
VHLSFSILMAIGLCVLTACAPHDPRAASVLALRGDALTGGRLYGAICAHCHKRDDAWPLTLQLYGADGVASSLIRGAPHTRMPSFARWSDQRLADVLAYVRTLK